MRMKLQFIALVTFTLAASVSAHQNNNGRRWNLWSSIICSKWFYNIWPQDDSSFEVERVSQMRTFVGQYSFDVGACPVGSCATRSYLRYFGCQDDGYICPVTETRQADLGPFGIQEYQYVTKCVCCKDEGISVKVHVVDSQTEESLGEMRVRFNKRVQGFTDDDGNFEKLIDSAESLVVTVQDTKDCKYLDAVKIIDIPDGVRVPIEVTLYMIKKAETIEIDSMSDTNLSVSADPTSPNTGNAVIVIERDSFARVRGRRLRPYNGPVKVSLTYIDTNNDPERLIPGRFLTPVGDTTDNLISDGIFAFDFTDEDGKELRLIKPGRFTVRKDMKLWNLNAATGLWDLAEDLSSNRGKRQVTLTDELLIDIQNGHWVNIDKIPGAPYCYFKARIFDETSGVEIPNSATASFRPEIIAYTNINQRLRLYTGSTMSPSDTCYEVRCPDVSDPDDALFGFINMSSIETVTVGGASVPYEIYLTPRDIIDYILPIRNRLSDVQYDIAPNDLDVFVNFVSNAAGPFYTSRIACENSPVSRPAFHFFKPALPSYVPVPNDTDICTARIVFKDDWLFYDYVSNLTSLPNVTSISVWEEDGQNYYYTDTVQLQQSGNGSDYFVFACLEYRCSEVDESTTVYLDINIPNATHYDNYTLQNGTVIQHVWTTPEFFCNGDCTGPLCNRVGLIKNNGTTIDGSFIAPANVSSGPDFYDSETTDCDERTASEPFAYEFYCYSNREGGQDAPA